MDEKKTEEKQIDGMVYSDRDLKKCPQEASKNAKLQPKTAKASQKNYELFRSKTKKEIDYMVRDIDTKQKSMEIDKANMTLEQQEVMSKTIKELQEKLNLAIKEEKKYIRKVYRVDVDSARPLKVGERFLVKIKGFFRKLSWYFSSYRHDQDSLDIKLFTNKETQDWLKKSYQNTQEEIVSEMKDIINNNFEVHPKGESNVDDDSQSIIVDYPQQNIEKSIQQESVQQENANDHTDDTKLATENNENEVIHLPGPILEVPSQDSIGELKSDRIIVPVADQMPDMNKMIDSVQKIGINMKTPDSLGETTAINQPSQNNPVSIDDSQEKTSTEDQIGEVIDLLHEVGKKQMELSHSIEEQKTVVAEAKKRKEETHQNLRDALSQVKQQINILQAQNIDLEKELAEEKFKAEAEQQEEIKTSEDLRRIQGVLSSFRSNTSSIQNNNRDNRDLDAMLEDQNRRQASNGNIKGGKM